MAHQKLELFASLGR